MQIFINKSSNIQCFNFNIETNSWRLKICQILDLIIISEKLILIYNWDIIDSENSVQMQFDIIVAENYELTH